MRGRWGLVALTQVAKIAYVRRGTGCRRTSVERRSTEVFVSGATGLTTTCAAGFCTAGCELASVLQPLARRRLAGASLTASQLRAAETQAQQLGFTKPTLAACA